MINLSGPKLKPPSAKIKSMAQDSRASCAAKHNLIKGCILLFGFTCFGVTFGQSQWINISPPTQNIDLHSVVYGNGHFVVVGDNGTVLTSADGITWASETSGTYIDLYSVNYANGQYVAVGDGDNMALYTS